MTPFNVSLVDLHYKSCGTFCIQSKSPIISAVDLPTIEIIEPFFVAYNPLLNKHNQLR